MPATSPEPPTASPSRTIDQVLALILKGYTHPEIAEALHIAVHTASHRVSDLCRIHGVTSSRRLQAKFYADLQARHARSQSALACFERRSGVDRRRE